MGMISAKKGMIWLMNMVQFHSIKGIKGTPSSRREIGAG